MTPHDRYIGVARPAQGVDPQPPRLVVNLSRGRASPSPPANGEPGAPPARPRRYGGLAEHRRRLRRAAVRRWEFAVWSIASLVVVAIVALLVAGQPGPSGTISAWTPPPASQRPSPSVAGAACVIGPCQRPTYSGAPTVLRIPTLAVTTTLESLVLDGSGQLRPPTDYARAGWWTQGVPPGDVGPAVIAGHVDSATSGPAVFYNLHTLRPGDVVQVDRGGQTVEFVVTTVEQYPKDAFPTDKVYRPTPDAQLRLITCGGAFDHNRLSYRDNIVVYAVIR